ncbi:anti-virulence regulator CigR family protein [Tepidicaulis marinus]|nr:anti-virulence regulator CigR family protein [Tepidicaulis marinus]
MTRRTARPGCSGRPEKPVSFLRAFFGPRLLLAVVLGFSAGPAMAKSDKAPGHAGPPGHAKQGAEGSGDVDLGLHAEIRFGVNETEIIRDYFGRHGMTSKPLPPGIAKNLARGKPLPPGIAKRYLPQDLQLRLPVYEGYERLIVGDDVLLVAAATGIIVDILSDVL